MKNSEIILRKCSNPAGKFSFFIFPLLLFFYCGQVNAQVTKEVPAVKTPAVKTGAVNAGSLVTQFMNAIKPSSFTDQWAGEKSNWLASASKIASAPGMVESVSSLAKSIKPSMFKEGFKLDNLLQTATQAK